MCVCMRAWVCAFVHDANLTCTAVYTCVMIQVDPAEVWLRADVDNRGFFPDDSGNFNLPEASLTFGAVLFVEGPNLGSSANSRLTVSSTAQSSSSFIQG